MKRYADRMREKYGGKYIVIECSGRVVDPAVEEPKLESCYEGDDWEIIYDALARYEQKLLECNAKDFVKACCEQHGREKRVVVLRVGGNVENIPKRRYELLDNVVYAIEIQNL